MRGSARVLGPRAIPGDQMPGLRHVDPHPKPLPMRSHSASPLPNSLDPTGVVAYRRDPLRVSAGCRVAISWGFGGKRRR